MNGAHTLNDENSFYFQRRCQKKVCRHLHNYISYPDTPRAEHGKEGGDGASGSWVTSHPYPTWRVAPSALDHKPRCTWIRAHSRAPYAPPPNPPESRELAHSRVSCLFP